MSDKYGSYVHVLRNNSKNIETKLTSNRSLHSFIQDHNHLKLYKMLKWNNDDNILIITEQGIKLKIQTFYDSFNCIHYKYELIS